MYRESKRPGDDRGQVGIGTLIVFIAMVLVAAIAAGVLINTAGFLQSSAQATGQESSDSTTNQLQVVSTTGTHLDNNEVGVVRITVKKGPGASDIDLADTTVNFIGPTGSFYQLAADGGTGSPDGFFELDTVQDSDGSSPVLNDAADRLTIVLDLGDDDYGNSGNEFGSELGEGETATVRITTGSGGTTTDKVIVPETLSSGSAVRM